MVDVDVNQLEANGTYECGALYKVQVDDYPLKVIINNQTENDIYYEILSCEGVFDDRDPSRIAYGILSSNHTSTDTMLARGILINPFLQFRAYPDPLGDSIPLNASRWVIPFHRLTGLKSDFDNKVVVDVSKAKYEDGTESTGSSPFFRVWVNNILCQTENNDFDISCEAQNIIIVR